MKVTKAVFCMYDYIQWMSEDVLYNIFRHLGVKVLYTDNSFSIFTFILKDGENTEDIEAKLDECVSDIISFFDRDIEYDISFEEVELSDIEPEVEYLQLDNPLTIKNIIVVPSGYDEVELTSDGNTILRTSNNINHYRNGKHQTTKSLLLAVDKYCGSGENILDIGDSIGIVAFYAFKKGYTKLHFYDTDADMKNVLKEECKLNNIGVRKMVFAEKIEEIPSKEYSIISINLPINKLKDNAINVKPYMTNDTYLFLTGFYSTKIKEMIDFVESENLSIEDIIHVGYWSTFVCKLKDEKMEENNNASETDQSN